MCSKSLTIEEAEARHSDMVKGQAWVGPHTKYKYICKTHGVYKQRYTNHQQGRGCRRCGINTARRPLGIEEAEKRHKDLIKGQEWRGSGAKYKYTCGSHGEYLQTFGAHSQGQGCPQCGFEQMGIYRLLTIQEAEHRHKDLIKGQVWRGCEVRYEYLCKKHGVYRQKFTAHGMGKGCQKCGHEIVAECRRLTIGEAEQQQRDLIKGQTWRGCKEKYFYHCRHHGAYRQQFNNHGSGNGCQKCWESKGEKRVSTFLLSVGLVFEREKRFNTCRNYHRLPFDFFIPSNTLIEYHGGQHYRAVDFAGSGKAWARQQFRGIQHRDHIKKRWAKKNGYRLIVIPYTVKSIEQYLSKRLSAAQIQQAAKAA